MRRRCGLGSTGAGWSRGGWLHSRLGQDFAQAMSNYNIFLLDRAMQQHVLHATGHVPTLL